MGCTELTTYDDLLTASGDDPFVRWMADRGVRVRGWRLDEGVAWVWRTPAGAGNLTVVAAPPRLAAAALPELLTQVPEVSRITVPFGSLAHLDADLAARIVPGIGDDWEWMLTTSPPPEPDVPVSRLEPQRLADVTELLAAASPRHSATVDDPDVIAWWGVRDGDRLVACAAHTEEIPGVPGLASIATDPDYRGRGLGAAVTAGATRGAFALGRPVVTLGMYSDNAVARHLYHRLGFSCDHRWSSRRLGTPPR